MFRICAHRRESPFHGRARGAIATLAASGSAWAIPWPSLVMLHEGVDHWMSLRAFPSLTVRNPLID